MTKQDIFRMRPDEVQRCHIVRKVLEGDLTQREGVALAGIGERQMRRVVGRVRQEGERGVMHRSRGQASSRCYPEKLKRFDYDDGHGIRIHKYGPHVFHTKQRHIVDYLSQFTAWRRYEHHVLADVDGKRVSFPINMNTLNQLYGLGLSDSRETRAFLASVRVPIAQPENAEEYALSRVGRDLYEKLFRGYTKKHWGIDAAQLRPSVIARIPVRTDTDDRYFRDAYQLMPAAGYARMFERMLAHPQIDVLLKTDYHDIVETVGFRYLIYTGPIDRFFDYHYGRLPYRGLRLVHEHHHYRRVQEVGTINYPNGHAFTRTTECKHLTGQKCRGTTLTYEYPVSAKTHSKQLYYPIPTDDNEARAQRYRDKAATLTSAAFCGRLAEYRYYNMDEVIVSALRLFRDRIARTAQPLADKPHGSKRCRPGDN